MDNVVAASQMHTGLDAEATIELGTDILTGELKQDDPIWTGLQDRGGRLLNSFRVCSRWAMRGGGLSRTLAPDKEQRPEDEA